MVHICAVHICALRAGYGQNPTQTIFDGPAPTQVDIWLNPSKPNGQEILKPI